MYYAHRGNLEGRITERENQPEYIDEAIAQGFGAEIDLWKIGDRIYLGHDDGQHDIDLNWLHERKQFLLVHTKNKEAFEFCLKNKLHAFWHTEEDYVITTQGYVVGYPGRESVGDFFIMGVPEKVWPVEEIKKHITFGVISDYVKTLNNR
jgi:hypothetical protein